jgi:hypothetical protein
VHKPRELALGDAEDGLISLDAHVLDAIDKAPQIVERSTELLLPRRQEFWLDYAVNRRIDWRFLQMAPVILDCLVQLQIASSPGIVFHERLEVGDSGVNVAERPNLERRLHGIPMDRVRPSAKGWYR